jgi:hypothetical protein
MCGVGMQAFVLLVSAEPLPPYARWRQTVGRAPWGKAELGGIWLFGDAEFGPGLKRREDIPEPVSRLGHFFQGHARIEGVRVRGISFPVKSRAHGLRLGLSD